MTDRIPHPAIRKVFLFAGYLRLSVCLLAVLYAIYAVSARPTSPFWVGFRNQFIARTAGVPPSQYNAEASGAASFQPVLVGVLTALSLRYLARTRHTALAVTLSIDVSNMLLLRTIPVWPVLGLIMLLSASKAVPLLPLNPDPPTSPPEPKPAAGA